MPSSRPVSGSCTGAAAQVQALHGLVEVLGRKDLHGVVGGQGRSDRVRAGSVLAPESPLGEVHRVGGGHAHPRVAPDPQQEPVGVTDDDEVRRLVCDGREAVLDQGQRGGQRMHVPARRGLLLVGENRCEVIA